MQLEQNSLPKLRVLDPAENRIIEEIDETPPGEAGRLYENARTAFESWSALPVAERIRYLRKLRHYLAEHMEESIQTVSRDTGKVEVEALMADLMPVLDALQHIEKHAGKILGREKKPTPIVFFGKKSYVEYMPRGVVLVISPWNYPLQLAMIPAISALAAGNTVILKPSEVTPLVGLHIEKVFKEAGFPDNVIQVAHGGKELGAALTKGKPDYIFFTGSVRTGQIIQEVAAKDLIPTTLELGGKDPMIVFKDANIERAVQGAIWGAFTNSGQTCMAIERLYVERPIYETFLQKLIGEVNKLKHGKTKDGDIGSMTFPGQLDIMRVQLEEALANGAKLATGTPPGKWNTDKGLYVPPTVVTEVGQDMKIMQEESFGPLLPIMPFDTEEEAIALANGTEYGLNSSIYTSDIAKAERVASKLVSGGVVINDVLITVANHHLPFGGAKKSGIGRYHGDEGLRIFTHPKAVMVDKGRKDTELPWYPYEGTYPHFKKLFHSMYGRKRNWIIFAAAFLALMRKKK
ncbi:aldehyde dehydrogenase family protein [Bacillus marinisedimentorum]|uniref:aldehyde dehydrogenase family protein n=1 Tax=Bacillus marinisedimentorum TaxID=1821260 RepID=UPI000872C480|nr:aldehyde dehydrogenase family protein [Bacillus marinisedimentorum]